ncbi:hypothetical protein [Deinococcus sp.]|uniref:hypothetical protein n=1 Tax=Deinococcus sp. TaxID=47478 RepID=UPI0025C092FC|nr:hypothetical protein [Deinococcus sp.]
MNHWAELVELYEYKVADVIAGRMPRGGRHALTELRTELLGADLNTPLLRRLIQTDRQFRQWRKAQSGSQEAAAVAPEASAWEKQAGLPAAIEAGPEVATHQAATHEVTAQAVQAVSVQVQASIAGKPDREALAQAGERNAADYQLHVLAWNQAVRQRLGRMTRDLRYEPQRPTLRVLYALSENTERALRGVTERFAVPVANDPLVSLGDKQVVANITSSFCDLLLTEQGRQQALRSLTEIQHNPFPSAGHEAALRDQLSAAQREPTAHAREQLRAALLAQRPQAPEPHERPVLREAAIQLRRLIEQLFVSLPLPVPGTPLFVADPLLKGQTDTLAEVSVPQLLLDLRTQPQQLRWYSWLVRWRRVGTGDWQLQVGRQVLTLRPGLPPTERFATVTEGPYTAEVFYDGHYVLLSRPSQSAAVLGPLATQARALRLLLDPASAYGNLRLARAAAQDLRGSALNLAALAPESAERFSQAAPDDLQKFARQGLHTLRERIAQTTPQAASESLERCAEALGLPQARAEALNDALMRVLDLPEAVMSPAPVRDLPGLSAGSRLLRPNGQFQSFELGDEPLTLGVRGRTITLRWDYKRDLILLIPGLPNALLEDLLVVPLGDLDLLLIRHGSLVALAAAPYPPEPDMPQPRRPERA